MYKLKNNFYNLSTDYNLLYDNICKGNKIACFVNYNFRVLEGKYPPCRDICLVVKTTDFDIDFLARGISYGMVSDYFKDSYTEKEVFISECKRMELEWINN